MIEVATNNLMAALRERARVIRLDCPRAFAMLPAVLACAACMRFFTLRVWAVLAGFQPFRQPRLGNGRRCLVTLCGMRIDRLQSRPKRVCHACCRLNKAPPAHGDAAFAPNAITAEEEDPHAELYPEGYGV